MLIHAYNFGTEKVEAEDCCEFKARVGSIGGQREIGGTENVTKLAEFLPNIHKTLGVMLRAKRILCGETYVEEGSC